MLENNPAITYESRSIRSKTITYEKLITIYSYNDTDLFLSILSVLNSRSSLLLFQLVKKVMLVSIKANKGISTETVLGMLLIKGSSPLNKSYVKPARTKSKGTHNIMRLVLLS